jgi:hypothetical protein
VGQRDTPIPAGGAAGGDLALLDILAADLLKREIGNLAEP